MSGSKVLTLGRMALLLGSLALPVTAAAQIPLQAPAPTPPAPAQAPQRPQPQPAQPQRAQPQQAQPQQAQPQRPATPARPAAETPAAPKLPPFPTELPVSGSQFVIIDGRLILSQSNAALSLRRQAEQQNGALRAEVQKHEQEFKAAQADIQRQQRGQTPNDQLEKRVRDLQKRMSDAQTQLQNRTRALDRAFADAEQKIYQAMIQATVELAQEKNYQLILDKSQVVVVQSQYEITGEILNRVNQQLNNVTLQMSQN